jgi:hypothetical protein
LFKSVVTAIPNRFDGRFPPGTLALPLARLFDIGPATTGATALARTWKSFG